MKNPLWYLIIIFISTISQAQNMQDTTTDTCSLIVRVQTFSSKIRFLTSKINDLYLSNDKKENYIRQLNETTEQKEKYMALLKSVFKEHFHVCAVLFVPDTLYKNFLGGDSKVFIGEFADIKQIDIKGPNVLYMAHGKDEYQYLLTDKEGKQFLAPWPYKKIIFFPALQQLIDKKSYITKQIKWFDKKIRIALQTQ